MPLPEPTPAHLPIRRPRVPRAVLAVGAALGLLLALTGAVVPARSGSGTVPVGGAARVNTAVITTAALVQARERLGDDGTEAAALNFLIDEELLVQRGMEMGLVESDRTVRKAIVMTMIDTIVADRLARKPSPEELRAYYESHRAVFTQARRLHVRHMLFSAQSSPAAAMAQATAARDAVLAGTPFHDARAQFGAQASALPDGLVPVHVLRRYLGPALTGLIEDLPAGSVPDVVETSTGFHVVQVEEVQTEHCPPLAQIADVVEREYLRRARDDALDAVLRDLRAGADIALAKDAPGTGATTWK